MQKCFPPVKTDTSKILILGSYPSPLSFESGFYYGHPRNRFWPLIAELLEDDVPITVEEKIAMLKRHDIALWDVLESCEIKGASDASIRNPVNNPILPLIEDSQIRAVFFNGAKAEELYRKHQPALPVPSFRLPSTSPANAAWNIDKLRMSWKMILDYLK